MTKEEQEEFLKNVTMFKDKSRWIFFDDAKWPHRKYGANRHGRPFFRYVYDTRNKTFSEWHPVERLLRNVTPDVERMLRLVSFPEILE